MISRISLVIVAIAAAEIQAADPENCLGCHRYRGLARIGEDGQTLRLFHVDPDYYDRGLGPHARLRCTDCHLRSEVEVIPHQAVTPVDCTRTCHLSAPDRPPLTFSHADIQPALAASVHTRETLAEANRLLGAPLSPGQSYCLLCHDEPRFQRDDELWRMHVPPVARCETCHTNQLEIDAQYQFWHVFARSRPARNNVDSVRVCAMCHSNPLIRASHELPDTTASFLASFHGKAMLLGSGTTAMCMDCHTGQGHSVHMIRAKDDPASPTHADRLADTCRSAECHPAAGRLVSSAAVHLELTPTQPAAEAQAWASSLDGTSTGDMPTERPALTIEYAIAVIFIFLILSTFGPSLALQTLELIQIIVGRHDPGQHDRARMARRLQAHPEGKRLLVRFTPHQRLQHWLLFATFTLLVATGFPIKFADQPWAGWLIDAFGGLKVARYIHRYAGLVLVLGAVYHLAYGVCWIVGHKRRASKSWLKAAWDLPMLVKPSDLKELFQLLGYLLFLRNKRPQPGRFSLKEKFEYFGVFWGCTLLGLTGLLMWGNALTTRYVPGRVLTIAMLIHTFEAFLALLHVGIFHMIGVILSPHVFPISKAMLGGDTPPDELAEAHGGMITSVAEAVGITADGEAAHGA